MTTPRLARRSLQLLEQRRAAGQVSPADYQAIRDRILAALERFAAENNGDPP